jgi:aryl-alcohol dehydrogenase-like predicted oxidoreductase
LISGHWSKERSANPDFRSHLPRFQGGNLEKNLSLVESLRQLAEAKGRTVAQVAIGWVLSRGEDIVPLIGARRRDRLDEALGALDFSLTADDLAQIERAIQPDAVAGERYDPNVLAHLDSERK